MNVKQNAFVADGIRITAGAASVQTTSIAKEGGENVLTLSQTVRLSCQPKSSVALWCNGSTVPCVGNGPGSSPGGTANFDDLTEAAQHETLMRHLNGGAPV